MNFKNLLKRKIPVKKGIITIFISMILVVVILAFGCVSYVFYLVDPYTLFAPRDQKLIKTFTEHRQAFERLRQMSQEDSNDWRIDAEGPIFGNHKKISQSRREEYKNLILSIDSNMFMDSGDGEQWFQFKNGGFEGAVWTKGIAYLPGNKAGAVYKSSLDRMINPP
jgi:hypothetical protein